MSRRRLSKEAYALAEDRLLDIIAPSQQQFQSEESTNQPLSAAGIYKYGAADNNASINPAVESVVHIISSNEDMLSLLTSGVGDCVGFPSNSEVGDIAIRDPSTLGSVYGIHRRRSRSLRRCKKSERETQINKVPEENKKNDRVQVEEDDVPAKRSRQHITADDDDANTVLPEDPPKSTQVVEMATEFSSSNLPVEQLTDAAQTRLNSATKINNIYSTESTSEFPISSTSNPNFSGEYRSSYYQRPQIMKNTLSIDSLERQLTIMGNVNPQMSVDEKIKNWYCDGELSDVEDVNNFDTLFQQHESNKQDHSADEPEDGGSASHSFTKFREMMHNRLKELRLEVIDQYRMNLSSITSQTVLHSNKQRQQQKHKITPCSSSSAENCQPAQQMHSARNKTEQQKQQKQGASNLDEDDNDGCPRESTSEVQQRIEWTSSDATIVPAGGKTNVKTQSSSKRNCVTVDEMNSLFRHYTVQPEIDKATASAQQINLSTATSTTDLESQQCKSYMERFKKPILPEKYQTSSTQTQVTLVPAVAGVSVGMQTVANERSPTPPPVKQSPTPPNEGELAKKQFFLNLATTLESKNSNTNSSTTASNNTTNSNATNAGSTVTTTTRTQSEDNLNEMHEFCSYLGLTGMSNVNAFANAINELNQCSTMRRSLRVRSQQQQERLRSEAQRLIRLEEERLLGGQDAATNDGSSTANSSQVESNNAHDAQDINVTSTTQSINRPICSASTLANASNKDDRLNTEIKIVCQISASNEEENKRAALLYDQYFSNPNNRRELPSINENQQECQEQQQQSDCLSLKRQYRQHNEQCQIKQQLLSHQQQLLAMQQQELTTQKLKSASVSSNCTTNYFHGSQNTVHSDTANDADVETVSNPKTPTKQRQEPANMMGKYDTVAITESQQPVEVLTTTPTRILSQSPKVTAISTPTSPHLQEVYLKTNQAAMSGLDPQSSTSADALILHSRIQNCLQESRRAKPSIYIVHTMDQDEDDEEAAGIVSNAAKFKLDQSKYDALMERRADAGKEQNRQSQYQAPTSPVMSTAVISNKYPSAITTNLRTLLTAKQMLAAPKLPTITTTSTATNTIATTIDENQPNSLVTSLNVVKEKLVDRSPQRNATSPLTVRHNQPIISCKKVVKHPPPNINDINAEIKKCMEQHLKKNKKKQTSGRKSRHKKSNSNATPRKRTINLITRSTTRLHQKNLRNRKINILKTFSLGTSTSRRLSGGASPAKDTFKGEVDRLVKKDRAGDKKRRVLHKKPKSQSVSPVLEKKSKLPAAVSRLQNASKTTSINMNSNATTTGFGTSIGSVVGNSQRRVIRSRQRTRAASGSTETQQLTIMPPVSENLCDTVDDMSAAATPAAAVIVSPITAAAAARTSTPPRLTPPLPHRRLLSSEFDAHEFITNNVIVRPPLTNAATLRMIRTSVNEFSQSLPPNTSPAESMHYLNRHAGGFNNRSITSVLAKEPIVEEPKPKIHQLTMASPGLRNPLLNKHGRILYIYYELEVLIVVQEKLISFWKYSKVFSVLQPPDLDIDKDTPALGSLPNDMSSLSEKSWDNHNPFDWVHLGRCRHVTNDTEIATPYANRICLHNSTPIYLEMRCRNLPRNRRDCNLLSMYINIYYYNEDDLHPKMNSIYLDAVQGEACNVIYTTITESRYFVMSWPQETQLGKTRTGMCKYSITPNLDTLASIREFKSMKHDIKYLECLGDDKLIGYGNSEITIWDHRSGDILMNYDLGAHIGRNLGAIYYPSLEIGQNNMVVLFQLINTELATFELRLIACDISHTSPSHRIIQTHELPAPSFNNKLSSVNTGEHLILTAKNDEEIWVSCTDPRLLTFVSAQNTQRFYSRQRAQLIELTPKSLVVESFANHMLKLAATKLQPKYSDKPK